MYYNRIVLCGRVFDDPVIRTSKKGQNFVSFRLTVKRGTKDKGYDNFIVNAFGSIGNEILEKVKGNDYICVSGPMNAGAYIGKDPKGETNKPMPNLMVVAMEWAFDPTQKMLERANETMMNGGDAVEEEDMNAETLF